MTTSTTTSPTSGRDPVPPSSRYECLVKVASGGMATVYVGRLRGKHGFSRLVAIKRAHAHLLDDDHLRRGLIGEARLAAQIHDPHVVSVLDVDEPGGELMLVMDYIEGGSLSQLLSNAGKLGELLAPGVVARILLDSCAGLAAAHELRDDAGAPLSIVHRDVSPHNILVGVDGLSRIADFGIAKWAEATNATSAGLKGKFSYMAPEYIKTRKLDQRADVFALGVVAWEAFTGRRLFRGDGELETIQQVIESEPPLLSSVAASVPAAFDAPVARALEKDPSARYASARDFARALEAAAESAGVDLGVSQVGAAVRRLLGDVLEARRTVLRDLSGGTTESGKGSPGSSRVVECAEGVQTATATLDAAFATDARTLPIERPAAGSREAAPVAEATSVAGKGGLSVRASIALVVATALGVMLMTFLWSNRGATPSAPSPTQGVSVVGPAATSERAEAAADTAPSASVVLASATPSAPSSASARAPSAPVRRFPRHAESVAAPSSAKLPAPAPAATGSSTPTRPGLGY